MTSNWLKGKGKGTVDAIRDATSRIVGISELVNDDKTKWSELTDHIAEDVGYLTTLGSHAQTQSDDIRIPLERLKITLDQVLAEIRNYQQQTIVKRLASFDINADKIAALRGKWDGAVNAFTLHVAIAKNLIADRILDPTGRISLQQLSAELEDIASRRNTNTFTVDASSSNGATTRRDSDHKDALTASWDRLGSGEPTKAGESVWLTFGSENAPPPYSPASPSDSNGGPSTTSQSGAESL